MVRLFRDRFIAVSVVILLVLAALSVLSPHVEADGPLGGLILEPQLVNIMQGYGFNINVTLQDVTNLGWFGFDLEFDTSTISMQTYTYLDGWGVAGGCGASSPPAEGVRCSGEPPGGSFTGSAVILTITFRCEDAGSSQISPASWSNWSEAPYGSVFHNFAVMQGATVNQAAPTTVTSTVTTTTASVSTTVVTSWGYVTLPRTTTVTSLVTSVLTSVITSVWTTTGGSTVTSMLTTVSTTTIRTTSTVTGVTTVASPTTSTVTGLTTVASPTTITETTISTESLKPVPLPTGCVIATAAYGSELAPDVAYMRYVRDDLIGSSILGSGLVNAFNAFYYSWSPALAGWIAGSPLLMVVFRVLLLPLVGIVHATALVFTATARATGQTDVASLFAFLAAAAMTTTAYVLLPIMAAAKSTRATRGLRTRFQS